MICSPEVSGKLSPQTFDGRRPLVMADFLRPLPNVQNARHGMQNVIARQLYEWAGTSLRKVFLRPVELALWTDEDAGFPATDIYRAENLDPSTLGWSIIYNREPCAKVLEILAPLVEDRLVLGFELSPYQRRCFDSLRVPYLSLAIHPLRFMKDYAFTIESNFAADPQLAPFALDPEDIAYAAELKIAGMRALSQPMLKPNAAVLFGQVDVDAALISAEGGFLRLQDHVQALEKLFSEFETVYFKPHPHQDRLAALTQVRFLRQFQNIDLLTVNPYALMAAPETSLVAALTSSVLSESMFFGKSARALSDTWQNKSAEPAFDLRVLSVKFWRYLLSDNSVPIRANQPLSDVSLKSLLKVQWETFDKQYVEPSRHHVRIGQVMNFGENREADAFCLGPAWLTPADDHRWMSKGDGYLSFRLPPGGGRPFNITISVAAMASEEAPIRFTISIDGYIVLTNTFRDWSRNNLSFVLNDHFISSTGDVLLVLNCDQENSPKLIAGIPDSRSVSVAIFNFTAQQIGMGELLEVGRELYIPNLPGDSSLFGAGWHSSEPEGIWSDGRQSRLSFSLPDRPAEDLVIILSNVRAFLSDVVPTNYLYVSLNGELVLSHRFDLSLPTEHEVVLPLPRRLLQDESNLVHVDFELVASHSPFKAGYSNDHRDLGVSIESICVESALKALSVSPLDGVANIIGPFNIHTGLAVMTRNTYDAISIALQDQDACHTALPSTQIKAVNFNNSLHIEQDYGYVKIDALNSDINIFVGDVTRINHMVVSNGNEFLRNHYNVVYGAWELEQLPTYLADTRYIDEFWGLSDFIADAARARMNIPVYSMPLCVNIHRPARVLSRGHFGIRSDKFVFLFIFSADSTMARKNPEGVLEAFQLAFPNENSPVTLVIKTSIRQASEINRSALEAFKVRARNDKRVVLLEHSLSLDELASLYMNSDAYVSLHRSEGFGLTMAEAMGYGKPTIGTGYSGNLDFMRTENSCLVSWRKVDMDPAAYHSQLQQWAEPDLGDAAAHMLRVFEDSRFRETIARAGQVTILEEFSPDATGRKLLQRLAEIHKNRRFSPGSA